MRDGGHVLASNDPPTMQQKPNEISPLHDTQKGTFTFFEGFTTSLSFPLLLFSFPVLTVFMENADPGNGAAQFHHLSSDFLNWFKTRPGTRMSVKISLTDLRSRDAGRGVGMVGWASLTLDSPTNTFCQSQMQTSPPLRSFLRSHEV